MIPFILTTKQAKIKNALEVGTVVYPCGKGRLLLEESLRGFSSTGKILLLDLNVGYTVLSCLKIQAAEH